MGGRLIRGFAIQFVLLVALLPVAVTTIDFAARLLRRGVSFGAALRGLRSRLLVWLWAGALAVLFTVVGLFPSGGGRPLPLDSDLAQNWPFGALLGLLALSTLGWFLARIRLVRRGRVMREDELAGHAVMMLLLCVVAAVLAIANPYSLLFLLPSMHALALDSPLLRQIAHSESRALRDRLRRSVGLAHLLRIPIFTRIRCPLVRGHPVQRRIRVARVLRRASSSGGRPRSSAGALVFDRYAPYTPPPGSGGRGPLRETVRSVVFGARSRQQRRLAKREKADGDAGRELAVPPRGTHERIGLSGGDDHV